MEFITRVLSLKYNKYVIRENNRLFKSPNEVAKHNTLGNVKLDVWCREHKALQDRVTARVDEFNRHEIKFAR